MHLFYIPSIWGYLLTELLSNNSNEQVNERNLRHGQVNGHSAQFLWIWFLLNNYNLKYINKILDMYNSIIYLL